MNAPAPVVDLAQKTVTYEGKTYTMRPLSEDSFTVLTAGIPVGRVVFSFGAANAVVEGDITEDALWYIGDAWFKALEENAS